MKQTKETPEADGTGPGEELEAWKYEAHARSLIKTWEEAISTLPKDQYLIWVQEQNALQIKKLSKIKCQTCDGTGYKLHRYGPDLMDHEKIDCDDCSGVGFFKDFRCPKHEKSELVRVQDEVECLQCLKENWPAQEYLNYVSPEEL